MADSARPAPDVDVVSAAALLLGQTLVLRARLAARASDPLLCARVDDMVRRAAVLRAARPADA
jgi:hypothetical protein